MADNYYGGGDSDTIIDFDIKQAKDLLKSIQMMGNLGKFKVPHPTDHMATMVLADWVNWLHDHTEYYGSTGNEHVFVEILNRIKEFLNQQVTYALDGFRKLISCIDRLRKQNDELKGEVSRLKDEIIDLKTVIEKGYIRGAQLPDPAPITTTPAPTPTPTPAPTSQPVKQPYNGYKKK